MQPSSSSTLPVISGVLGSIIASRSPKGIWFSTSTLLSTSKAPHPPSFPCMPSTHPTALLKFSGLRNR